MIITKDFVFLNFPKTGSSFLRTVIKEILDRRMNRNPIIKLAYRTGVLTPLYKEILTQNIIFEARKNNPLDQHGIYIQIPIKDRQKKIVSIVRNPYEKLLSTYEYRFWAKNPNLQDDVIKENLPNFPDLSLNEYIDYLKLFVKHSFSNIPPDVSIGTFSLQFIHYFFKNPKGIINNLSSDYINSNNEFKNDIVPVEFLKQESLNVDLSNFLLNNGFSDLEADFALNYPVVNKTKPIYSNRESLLTDKAIEYINKYENLYMNILKLYDIEYDCSI